MRQQFSAAMLAMMAAAFAPAARAAAISPACLPPVEAADVRVVRVEKNGVLVLDDGRAVKIEGLILPRGDRDHAPQFLVDQTIHAIEDLLIGRRVNLHAQRPKEDRYGRLRAQIIVDEGVAEKWLQRALLHRGLARVAIAPDRRECVGELLASEQEARVARNGVWSQPAYALRKPGDQLARYADTFQIVEGNVLSVGLKSGRAFLDFGSDWRHDFTVTISPQDLREFRNVGVDPQGYEGKKVRVRGWVEIFHRPEIAVAGPQDIEVLGTD